MERFKRDRLPFLSALGFGLAAYGFCMTNKIPVGDDLVGLFSKGATTVSGRYGLELMRLVMPDASMPWIYGLMSILLLAAAVCVILRIFPIQSRVLQVLLAGVIVCFPAEAGTMLYMFTAAPYAFSLLLTVAGLWFFTAEKKGRWLLVPLLIGFSCSIYQGYFSVAASLCVVRMIVLLCCTETSWREVFREGRSTASCCWWPQSCSASRCCTKSSTTDRASRCGFWWRTAPGSRRCSPGASAM